MKMINIRLNMTEQKANYKAKYEEDLECPDTTEHLVEKVNFTLY